MIEKWRYKAQLKTVRTYNFLENIDLIEEHTLLVVVHVTLAENLDGTLSSRFSVNAHANLTKGTYRQD